MIIAKLSGVLSKGDSDAPYSEKHTRFALLAPMALLIAWMIGVLHASAGPTHELVASFDSPPQKAGCSSLVLGPDGLYWGTTVGGGAFGYGTVFKVDASSGLLTTVVEFTSNGASNKGAYPYAGLVSDGVGYLWGTTFQGGASNDGTVYKVNTTSGELTTVVEFNRYDWNYRGAYPIAGLVSDGVGNFWGTTSQGNPYLGTVYKVNASSGVLTIVVDFDGQQKGAYPYGGLISDGAGYFWGTTYQGGASNGGAVYKVNVNSGVLTKMADLGGQDQSPLNPLGSLVLDDFGQFWGTSSQGGSTNKGSAFMYFNAFAYPWVTFDGPHPVNQAVEEAGRVLAGASPYAGMVSDGAGHLWGTTYQGGASNNGTVYKLTPTHGGAPTATMTVMEFTGDGDQSKCGANPGYGTLFKAPDGNLYGTTDKGGPGGAGTIFRLRFGPSPVTQAATLVTTTGCTLNGTLNPNGNATTASFEWSSDPNLANSTIVDAGTTTAGSVPEPVTASLTGLQLGTTYYYRVRGLNAENAIPQTGQIMSFTALSATAPRNYTGVITGADAAHSGTLKIRALGSGAFTGSLSYAGATYALNGTLDASGKYSVTLSSKGKPSLVLSLSSGVIDGGYALFGKVLNTTDNVSSDISTTNTIFSKANPAPQAGSYTIVILPDTMQTDGSATPQGYGIGSLKVLPTRSMIFAGTLADGTKFTYGGSLTRNGVWHLFLPLYAKTGPLLGMLGGTIRFDAGQPGSDLNGSIKWIKPANPSAVFYKNGFTLNTSLRGSAYDPAGSTGLTLNRGTNTFAATAGNLSVNINEAVSAGTGMTSVKVAGDDSLALTVNRGTGLVTGTFKHPDTSLNAPVRAVIYQKGTPSIFGNFTSVNKTGTNEAGSVVITSP